MAKYKVGDHVVVKKRGLKGTIIQKNGRMNIRGQYVVKFDEGYTSHLGAKVLGYTKGSLKRIP